MQSSRFFVCLPLLLCATNAAIAAPATHLGINLVCSASTPSICVAPPPPPMPAGTGPQLGQPVSFPVVALDASGYLATNYTGTVTITAATAAILPPSYTYTASDASLHNFSITFTSLPAGGGNPAPVSVTATDNSGLTGSDTFFVRAAPSSAVQAPGLSAKFALLLVGAIGFSALFSLRRWRKLKRHH